MAIDIRTSSLNRLEMMDLPDEILLMILRFLDYDSLLDAIYVNKLFHDLAEPFLYESITVLHGEKALNLSHSLAKNGQRPDWVRKLLISTKFGQEHALMKLPPFISLMENIQELRLETPDCNRKKAEDRVFWIALQDWYERIFRESSVLVSDPRSRLLPNLKTCVLHFVDTHTELYSLTRYASIFLHPTLESLRISCMSTDFPERLFEDIEDVGQYKRSTALQHLHLEECDLFPASLELLLSFPSALKSLKISEGIRYDGIFRAGSSRMHGNVLPHLLAQALTKTCKDSLENLSLALGYVRGHGFEINHRGQYLGLQELHKLKYLEVNNRTLNLIRSRPNCDHNTWKRLPSSLETLKVFQVPLIPPQHDNRQPSIPLQSCIVREKLHHGLSNLNKIIYSYEHYESTDDDEMNFNDLLMNLVYNEANGNPPPEPVPQIANQNPHVNPILNLLQQAVGVVNPPEAAPIPAPANTTFITAGANPNLDVPPQNIQPPRFRWRSGPQPHQRLSRPELSRSDAAKLNLLNTVHETVLDHFLETKTDLEIELVTLPRGFIPPYLFPEDKPRTQEQWFTSKRPRTPQQFLDGIRRSREAARMHLARSAYRRESDESSASFESGYVNERARSRSRFMRRLREGQYDDELVPDLDELDGDVDAPDAHIQANIEISDENPVDGAMQIEDVLDMFVHESVIQAGSEDEYTSETASDSSEGGSVYVDAGTDVEMSEVGSDGDGESDEDGSFGYEDLDFMPMR